MRGESDIIYMNLNPSNSNYIFPGLLIFEHVFSEVRICFSTRSNGHLT